MEDAGLLIAGLAAGAAGAVFVGVGFRLAQRPTTARAERAAKQFALFWIALGSALVATGLERILAGLDSLPLPLPATVLYLEVLLICVALWGLVAFLVYAFTGRDSSLSLGVFYAGYYVFLLYGITAARPDGYSISEGSVNVTYANQFSVPFGLVLVVLLFLPELAATVAYLSLATRVRDVTIRYRIGLVGLGLLLLLVVGSLLPQVGVLSGVVHTVVVSLIDAVSASIVFLAYFPPLSVRRRLALRRFDEEAMSADPRSA
jgi:hypothetical protein